MPSSATVPRSSVIFVKDGRVWTSAGITAGIDMALAIVSEDLGRESALHVARSMVAQMVRSGGQSQYSPALGRQVSDGLGRFEALHAWMSENLGAELSVGSLASKAGMSARNFARVYSKVMGKTPAKAVEAMRIERAQDLLETSSKSLKQIATLSGFKEEEDTAEGPCLDHQAIAPGLEGSNRCHSHW
ncbi:helix-turn-helix domain-containing protein [uncultured Tateyamaria sp.]|uniref:GlxA family transcriptional regulator n=1 Tax=uncultured Tateyamaria sp. TaxID=455651 RepID=UPI00260D60A9|nr:helix-turn-helix domain-containing protein [uncultured Tateyamaria sp.]